MAQDEAAVPLEAAASLFGGGDETAADFFSSGFDDVAQETSQEQHLSLHDTGAAANLFEAGPDETTSSLFQSQSYAPLQQDPVAALDSSHVPSANDVHEHVQADHGSSGYQDQGWQDEYGQWHAYDYQNGYNYDYASQPQQPADTYAPQQYDYAPQPSTVYAPQQPNYSTPQDVYVPPQPSQPYNYVPSGQQSAYEPSSISSPSGDSSQNMYNPYAPAVQPSANPLTAPPAPYAGVAASSQITKGTRDVTAYRPTTLNAYDPPIPSKSRYKRSTFSPPAATSPLTNGVHYQHTSPPPPPPHRASEPLAHPSSFSNASEQAWDVNGHSSGAFVQPQASGLAANAVKLSHEQHERVAKASLGERSVESFESMAHEHGKVSFPEGSVAHEDSPRQWYTDSHDDVDQQDQVSQQHEPPSALYTYDPENGPSSVDSLGSPDVVHPNYDNTSHLAQHSLSYSLDDQPFGDGHNIADIHPPSVTPPLLTGSPAPVTSYDPETTAGVNPRGEPTSQQTYDPYNPAHHSRQNSDTSHAESTASEHRPAITQSWDPYAPQSTSVNSRKDPVASGSYDTHDTYHSQDTSPGDMYAPPTELSHGPYTPSSRLQRAQSRQSSVSYDGEYISRYNYTHAPDSGTLDGGSELLSDPDAAAGYANVMTAPTYAPYAPSPSLLGTNDPLGRAAARVPVISFGFGGKLVSCFHSASETASGFDVSLTARQSTDVQIRTLHEVIPASAMGSSASSYPGPLFSDPGSPSISLARTVGVGTGSNAKAKKATVSKWLEERVEELSSGITYISSGTQERYNAEGKLVLIRLLKAMVDNDGQLSGSPAIEWDVRSALIPRLERPISSVDGMPASDPPLSSYVPALADLNEPSLAVYHLRPSSLDRIQEFLLRGERRQAYHYALDEKLWAHAMLIASSLDNQSWKEVVNEFLHSELAVKRPPGPLPGTKPETVGPSTNGRESLRVAYSLFAGQGAAAVQELIPRQALPTSKESLLAPPSAFHVTPISPNFPQPALTSSVPHEALAKWYETAAVMAFSQATGDSAALTALGDYLAANRWFEAAHACYLLSPRTSSLGGAGVPSVRVVLVGSESPSALHNFYRDLDVTILSEIVEFALSLCPAKGQDAFGGLPHLQAYKLIRAAHLAEMGHVEAANRYCEAIGSVIRASTRGSAFYTPTFIGELKNLSDRLTAAPQLDKTASWISRKVAKPSLDTIGSWLEGRFSKLIVGEGEDGAETGASEPSQSTKATYGPFSHYSTISSATTSASPSPSPTPYAQNHTDVLPTMPFGAYGTPSHVQIDRASSAMDHLRPEARRTSPVPRVASASAATTTFAQASNPVARYRQSHEVVSDVPETEGAGDAEGQEVSWWGSGAQDRSEPTPTAATFYKIDEGETGGNFVSLMDSYSPQMTPMAPTSKAHSQSRVDEEDDEEDLGFSTRRTPKPADHPSEDEAKNKSKDESKTAPNKPELKQQSSSWFGRWWSKNPEPAQSGPIRAKLGEETSFYYDKELKRWINKKVGAEASAPTPPPPPPSRPQTTSPSSGGPPGSTPAHGARPSTTGPSMGPPTGPPTGPPRPASAGADLAMPPRKPPRVRSNLVPKEEFMSPGSAPPSATTFDAAKAGPSLAPPSGIGRPKSSASKRNVRSRYVDVFQQQNEP